jgi:type IV secretory pathway TrbF-like protein
MLAASLILASCSGTGSKSSSPPRASACTYVAKLDDIANSVGRADVHDPVAFKKTLAAAVSRYVSNVRELRAVAPVELHDGLDRIEADVQQFRFDAALTDRVALDAYAARTCGRVVGTVTTTSGPPAEGER